VPTRFLRELGLDIEMVDRLALGQKWGNGKLAEPNAVRGNGGLWFGSRGAHLCMSVAVESRPPVGLFVTLAGLVNRSFGDANSQCCAPGRLDPGQWAGRAELVRAGRGVGNCPSYFVERLWELGFVDFGIENAQMVLVEEMRLEVAAGGRYSDCAPELVGDLDPDDRQGRWYMGTALGHTED
jgi:hypothetical protein